MPGYMEHTGNEFLHSICNNPSKYREDGGSTILNPKSDPQNHIIE
jgi:hypothetical protein